MRKHVARKRVALGSAVALALTTVLSAIAGSGSASAATLDVGYTLEGCDPDAGSFDPATVTCADADYGSGNLGKAWSELDLVPFRVTLTNNGTTSESGNFVVAGDYKNGAGTATGWDFISTLTLNTDLSDPGCQNLTSGSLTITPSGSGAGGADQTIYRMITGTVPADSTCVYDYYMRLALGAHNFSGSSLQANLWNENLGSQGIGEKRRSLPVSEIAPQGLSKDMTATQDSDHVWDVVKSPTPATVSFADTCDPSAPLSTSVAITVTWTKHAASPSGVITVVTHVYADNPALRDITVNVNDVIRSGTTVLDTASAGPTNVPANTANFLLLTHTTTVPAGTTNLNDIATATYTDTVTQLAIPGTTTATASATVQSSGNELNDSATINDVEGITGTGLTFSTDSVTGASGSFDNGYVAGTPTTGPVSWTSDSQSGSGSVTFNKTIYASAATIDSSGSLDDTATLNGADGFTTSTPLSVGVSQSALVNLTINKRRSPVTSENQTFNFDVSDSSDVVVASPSITVPGGTAANVDTSTTVSGLQPGSYTVDETATGPYPSQSAGTTITPVSGDAASCTGSVSFNNVAAPASARVRKITAPTSSGNWTFTLTGPNGLSETLTNVVANAGYVDFASTLSDDGGVYTITETPQAGYDLSNVAGDYAGTAARVSTSTTTRTCSFTLDLPADSGGVLSCTFTNTQQGTIIVRKVTDPVGAPGNFTFTGDAAGTISDGGTITVSNLAPGTYTSAENDPTPAFDLTGISCNDGASTTPSTWNVSTRTATFQLDPGETITCTFTNRQRGQARVVKTVGGQAPATGQAFTFQLRTGATAGSAGTILETGTANLGNGGVINFATNLVPGTTYQLCEQMMPGWLTSLGPPIFVVYNPSGDNSVVCTDFTVTAGELKVFNIDNTAPPGGRALTIGFWKNWASCSGSKGRQRHVLDQTLASFPIAAGQSTHGVYIGDLYIDTCLEAVRILNKSTVNTGKKKARDPAFNLAAQLLAAKLNVKAGAEACPAAVNAINAAQSLLAALDFNGVTHDPISASQATQVNNLATTLDRYNNNLLC